MNRAPSADSVQRPNHWHRNPWDARLYLGRF